MPGPRAQPLRLTAKQREALEELTRSQTVQYRLRFRAQGLLLLAQGNTVSAVARTLSTTRTTVQKWRDRFALVKDVEALDDLPRAGRPPAIPLWVRLELIHIACDRPGEHRVRFRDLWSQAELQQALFRRTGFVLSISEVGRILLSEGLRPHRVRYWLHSQDPDFRKKVRAICTLYTTPPEGATILCVDEKTCIQALGRKHPMRPPRKHRLGRIEYEYRRYGTRALLGAFNVRTGQVFAHVLPHRTAQDLASFMNALARRYPSGPVYIIWDNLNTHCGPQWERFNRRHGGRFHFVYTPKHASWVNQIEIWFGILQRRVLRYGDFSSVEDLEQTLHGFVAHWNRHEAHPFRWTFRGRFVNTRRSHRDTSRPAGARRCRPKKPHAPPRKIRAAVLTR